MYHAVCYQEYAFVYLSLFPPIQSHTICFDYLCSLIVEKPFREEYISAKGLEWVLSVYIYLVEQVRISHRIGLSDRYRSHGKRKQQLERGKIEDMLRMNEAVRLFADKALPCRHRISMPGRKSVCLCVYHSC